MKNDNILFGFLCVMWIGLMSSWILSLDDNNMPGSSTRENDVHGPVLFNSRHFLEGVRFPQGSLMSLER